MIYNLSLWSDVGFAIRQALRTFSGKLAAVLYDWIIDLYNVFMYTARAEILSSEFVQGIYNKVGMILGIFMVFKLAFSVIQSLVDPNKITDERNGFVGIIKRSVIAVVLLGTTPFIFRTAFDFQNLIVGTQENSDNIIYKIVVGTAPSNRADSFGRIVASQLFFGFYKEDSLYKLNEGVEIIYPEEETGSGGIKIQVDDYDNLKRSVTDGQKSFSDTVDYLSITNSGHYVIDWNGLFAIGMAVVMIWILVLYSIQVATRVIQLAYLQLIAPVPILSYISDPEGSFKKWTSQCLTTYLDLFIRLAIIYFIITVSTQILEAWSDVDSVLIQSTGLDPDSSTLFWVVMFLIIGLLIFGKRVPDLLKDLFPNFGGGAASLGFGIKSPKKALDDIPLLGAATGKVLGYAGKGAKKVGGYAWNKTGGRGVETIKNKYSQWKTDREAYKAGKKKDVQEDRLAAPYYNDFINENYEKAFANGRDKNHEFAKTYSALSGAKKELDGVIKAGYTRDSREYMEAEKRVNNAQKAHDRSREKYTDLARREDALKRKKALNNSTSTSNSTSQVSSSTSNNSQSSYSGYGGNGGTATGAPTAENSIFNDFTDEEWKTKRANDADNEKMAHDVNPNEFFEALDNDLVDKAVNDNLTEEYSKNYDEYRQEMETQYEAAGWRKDENGHWNRPNNN